MNLSSEAITQQSSLIEEQEPQNKDILPHHKETTVLLENLLDAYTMAEADCDRVARLLPLAIEVNTFLAGFLLFGISGFETQDSKESDLSKLEARTLMVHNTLPFLSSLAQYLQPSFRCGSINLKH